MNKIFEKVAVFFEAVNSRVAKVFPGWKTKLTGGYILVAGNIAVVLGILAEGQPGMITDALVAILTNIETYLGTFVIWFRSLANRVK